jgi:hypothetical protein
VFGIAQSGSQRNSTIAHNNFLGFIHLTGRYTGSEVRLFANGLPTGLLTTVSNATPLDTNTTLQIGANNRPSAYDIPFIRYYNRALSDSEIKQNFDSIKGRYGL